MSEQLASHTTPNTPLIQTGNEFVLQFSELVSSTSPGDRVAMATMSVEPTEPLVRGLIEELNGAASRGVEVSFGVDAFTLLVDPERIAAGPLLSPASMRKPFDRRQSVLRELSARGAEVTVLNAPDKYFSNPLAGRSHIKTAVVNNTTFLPGNSLHGTNSLDAVVVSDDQEIADHVYDLTRRIVVEGSVKRVLAADQVRKFGNADQLLVDAGRPSKSVIMDSGYDAVDQSRDGEWLMYASQYFPSGKMARKLLEAYERGVDVHILHNLPSAQELLTRVVEQAGYRRQRKILPSALFADSVDPSDHLHAKVIANNNVAIVGSHNFSERGVRYGTAEIAYQSLDPTFANKVGHFMMQQFKLNDTLPVIDSAA